jgi:hypothetical protein
MAFLVWGVVYGFTFFVVNAIATAMGIPSYWQPLLSQPFFILMVFLLLPIKVFLDVYALSFNQDISGDASFEPHSGYTPSPDTPHSAPFSSTPFNEEEPDMPFAGPIYFRDIPLESDASLTDRFSGEPEPPVSPNPPDPGTSVSEPEGKYQTD